MKQMNVAEADMIGESLRLSRDGIMKQWDSFVKRGDKILASHTILGDEGHLLQWVNWLNKVQICHCVRKLLSGVIKPAKN